MADIRFEVVEHIGTIAGTERTDSAGVHWSKQINLVEWNGRKAKIDIREWTDSRNKMSKGITLTEDEAKEVLRILTEYFKG